MKLTEAIINQINEIPKLRYLLINLAQKQEETSAQNKKLNKNLKNLEAKYDLVKKDYDALLDSSDSSQLHQSDVDFERIRADFNQKSCEFLTKLIRGTIQNDAVQHATEIIEDFKNELNFTIQTQRDKVAQTISDQNKLIKEKTNTIEELREKAEKPISDDVEKLINEKDEAINQLKSMLQRSVKSDQRNQEQIKSLQMENKELTEMLSKSGKNEKAPVEDVAKLEMQISELEQRVSKSSASKELEQKNERLQMMLERSNRLYSQLDERYQELEKSLQQKHFYAIVEETFCFEIKEQMNSAPKKKEKSPKNMKIEYEAVIASLRKTLLQYFLCTDSNQVDLVPVILEIVGCTQEQVGAVTRSMESRKHLINKTGGFFGLFG